MLKAESETIFLMNYEDEYMMVGTFNRKWKKDLLKLADERPDECKIISRGEGEESECKVYIPKTWIKLKAPKIYTEEEKEARRKRGQALHAKYLNKKEEGEENE